MLTISGVVCLWDKGMVLLCCGIITESGGGRHIRVKILVFGCLLDWVLNVDLGMLILNSDMVRWFTYRVPSMY